MNISTDHLQETILLPFKDPNWGTKFLIGAGLLFANAFIPIIPTFFYLGYLYRIQQRVVRQKSGPQLPEWDNWEQLLLDGLKYVGVTFVYTLPTLVLMMGGFFIFLGAVLSQTNESISSMPEILMIPGIVISIGMVILGTLVSLVTGVLLPVGLVHMAVEDRFAAAFDFKGWGKNLRANLGGYLVVFLVISGLSLISTFAVQLLSATIILCVVVPFIFSAVYYYLGVISANLYANAYLQGQQAGQTEIGLPDIESPANI